MIALANSRQAATPDRPMASQSQIEPPAPGRYRIASQPSPNMTAAATRLMATKSAFTTTNCQRARMSPGV